MRGKRNNKLGFLRYTAFNNFAALILLHRWMNYNTKVHLYTKDSLKFNKPVKHIKIEYIFLVNTMKRGSWKKKQVIFQLFTDREPVSTFCYTLLTGMIASRVNGSMKTCALTAFINTTLLNVLLT